MQLIFSISYCNSSTYSCSTSYASCGEWKRGYFSLASFSSCFTNPYIFSLSIISRMSFLSFSLNYPCSRNSQNLYAVLLSTFPLPHTCICTLCKCHDSLALQSGQGIRNRCGICYARILFHSCFLFSLFTFAGTFLVLASMTTDYVLTFTARSMSAIFLAVC